MVCLAGVNRPAGCALLQASDGDYHICWEQFISLRRWRSLLSTLKLHTRSLGTIMDLVRNSAKLPRQCLQLSVHRTGAGFRREPSTSCFPVTQENPEIV